MRRLKAFFQKDKNVIRVGTALACVIVIGLTTLSFWNFEKLLRDSAMDNALFQAQMALDKDMALRAWLDRMGGVYVRVSDNTPPNPALAPKHREIMTSDGKCLTQIFF